MEKKKSESNNYMACGCPSTHIQSFGAQPAHQLSGKPIKMQPAGKTGSVLTHWPIQIRLIPPQAPFLKNCELLVAADCTAASSQNFQNDYLSGKVMMMGCPKFDDAQSYVEKFTEIIKTCKLKKITILIMEVPCCSAMNVIIKQAMDRAGVTVSVEQITISTQGEELERVNW